jgi:hypothetical protein
MRIPHLPKWKRLASTASTSESVSERRTKYLYQVLLIVSLVVNGALALRGQWASEQLNQTNKEKSKLEALKISLEAELLREKNTPTLIASRLQYEAGMFAAQLKRENLLPFLQNTKDYRIVDNEVLSAFIKENDFPASASARHGAVTFIVIANIGAANAYQLTARSTDGKDLPLGDLLAGGAILIPTDYKNRAGSVKSLSQNPSIVRFHSHSNAAIPLKELLIPAAAAQSWVPTTANIRGIGRASEGKQDGHILDILPGK